MRILDHRVLLDHIHHWEISEFLRVNDMCEKCLDEVIVELRSRSREGQVKVR